MQNITKETLLRMPKLGHQLLHPLTVDVTGRFSHFELAKYYFSWLLQLEKVSEQTV